MSLSDEQLAQYFDDGFLIVEDVFTEEEIQPVLDDFAAMVDEWADRLYADGKIADGMLPKAAAIDSALEHGVGRVHVISYKVPDSLLLEVFTNEGTGTLVVNDITALTPAEQGGAK